MGQHFMGDLLHSGFYDRGIDHGGNVSCVKSIRGDRGYTTRTFFGAFRDNFKAATLPYLIWLAVMIILGCDAYITYQVLKTGSMKGAFFYFFLIMIAVAIMWSIFIPIYCKI